ncbi:MAG: formyltetrahydrofolate deformylase [Myxococcales bacterium]|nr:formyltetrahydrofolate deformylase [Myxococcales bacterium]
MTDDNTTATLLVSCPDRKGLVAGLAQLLYGHGVNILDADQHTDTDEGQFFQRIRMDLAESHTDKVALERGIQEVAERFDMKYQVAYASHPKRVAIMVSKYDHCLHDLMLRRRAGELECEVPLIVSNHPTLESIAKGYDVPFHVYKIKKETKREQEDRILALLDEAKVDVVVLARYMQILSPEFCDHYAQRVINIHHSFLPAFVGAKPYHQAQRRGVKVVGATAHYVTSDLDEGPIIEQDVMRVSHRDTVRDLVRKGRDLERLVLSRAVRLHLEDRVLICGNKTVVFD